MDIDECTILLAREFSFDFLFLDYRPSPGMSRVSKFLICCKDNAYIKLQLNFFIMQHGKCGLHSVAGCCYAGTLTSYKLLAAVCTYTADRPPFIVYLPCAAMVKGIPLYSEPI